MSTRAARTRWNDRCQPALVVAVLVGHCLASIGAPMPVAARAATDQPFPCQDNPCGCATAAECWLGDCCCFTLEQKITWAEARGTLAPAHAYRLAALRAAQRAASRKPARKPSCCAPAPEAPAPSPCCQRGQAPAPTVCPDCDSASCEAEVAPEKPSFRWAMGVSARRCRGQGPLGALPLTLTAPVEPCRPAPPEWAVVGEAVPIRERLRPSSDPPPDRPPRFV